jgi:uncharacterized NAD-dependent epimerase/dehydratase family protein
MPALTAAAVSGVISFGKKLVSKDGRAKIKNTIQKGAQLVQKGRGFLNRNKNLTDAVAEGGPQLVETPIGYLATNEAGKKTANSLPYILGGGLLLLLLGRK